MVPTIIPVVERLEGVIRTCCGFTLIEMGTETIFPVELLLPKIV